MIAFCFCLRFTQHLSFFWNQGCTEAHIHSHAYKSCCSCLQLIRHACIYIIGVYTQATLLWLWSFLLFLCVHTWHFLCVSSCDYNCRSFGSARDQQTAKQQNNCSTSTSPPSPSLLLFFPSLCYSLLYALLLILYLPPTSTSWSVFFHSEIVVSLVSFNLCSLHLILPSLLPLSLLHLSPFTVCTFFIMLIFSTFLSVMLFPLVSFLGNQGTSVLFLAFMYCTPDEILYVLTQCRIFQTFLSLIFDIDLFWTFDVCCHRSIFAVIGSHLRHLTHWVEKGLLSLLTATTSS